MDKHSNHFTVRQTGDERRVPVERNTVRSHCLGELARLVLDLLKAKEQSPEKWLIQHKSDTSALYLFSRTHDNTPEFFVTQATYGAQMNIALLLSRRWASLMPTISN